MKSSSVIKLILIAVIVMLGLLVDEAEARVGSSSHRSSSGSLFASSRSRRPSGADPNDPRWRKGSKNNALSDWDKSSDSDNDKKSKKKKKWALF